MKNLLIVTTALLGLSFAACAQKLDESKVPAAVKAAFAKNYPAVKAKWENEKGDFEAGFTNKGKTMSILFKADGTMTESEEDIPVKALPVAVLPYIKQHYKGATIAEAAKIIKADGSVTYEAEVNKTDVLFDEKGNFLKEVKE